MRLARIKGDSGCSAVYHCMSRTVAGEKLLNEACREKMSGILMSLAAFCGLEVITYCMMANHFHLLIRVPAARELSDGELLQRTEGFYGKKGILSVLAREGFEKRGRIDLHVRQTLLGRMGDVSVFMKEFKQRFSRWFNQHSDRFGTLWAERFKSVLVEDCPNALQTVASYIDLNPVRAGLVEDPKEYRHCGYAAAVCGANGQVRRGLMSFLQGRTWTEASAEYRSGLLLRSAESGHSGKKALDRETIRKALKDGGRLSGAKILRLRIRHMTDGVVLGSKEFVDGVFIRYRQRFGPRRKSGARPIRAVPLPGLMALRDLRVDVVG
ncbi:MAG: transposase [Verrucomicrobia bacterium]|nr:transposase [Verrucomicrobiota bacterium]